MFGLRVSLRIVSAPLLLSVFALLLTGCTLETTAPDVPIPGPALHGVSYGAGQPVVGQHVYLMAATVSGVGSAGYGVASTSLLSAAQTGHSDTIGAYVLSDSNGNWALNSAGPTYFYTCPSASSQVYIYGVGGNPGAGTNSAASMMVALGSCGSLSSATSIYMNELTTVAAAYALSGFATDALHVSIPQYATAATQLTNTTDALAQTDLQNAFAAAANLVSNTTGVAVTTTSGGNGKPATAQVITLGNLLAACVNSNGATTNPSNCYTLFNNAGSTGGATGNIPTETATAAINIAHNPYVSSTVMTNLYGLQPGTGAPFAGGDTSQPTDFTVAIKFTGGGLNLPVSIAIDGSGNAWAANNNGNSISKFSPTGTTISGGGGYTGGGLAAPYSIAIDSSGNAWIANIGANAISEFTNGGAPVTTPNASPFTGGGLSQPLSIAIDGSGNAWEANSNGNSISEFTSSGTAVTIPNASPFTGGGLHAPQAIAIDASGNAWAANNSMNSISKFTSSGTAVSAPTASPFTGGGLNGPQAIAFDGSGNAWVANSSGSSLSKFSSTGTAISPVNTGYTGGGLGSPYSIAIDGSGNAWTANYGNNSVSNFSSSGAALSPISSGYTGGGLNQPFSIAIDGSGNVWVANLAANSITELVGAATPVVTPLPANFIAPYTAAASRP